MIYCVEDDPNIRDLIIYTLKSSGFEASGFEDAAQFQKAMMMRRVNVVKLVVASDYLSAKHKGVQNSHLLK